MESVSLNINSQYLNAFQANEKVENTEVVSNVSEPTNNSKIHNSAVDLSISMQSIKVFLNIKSLELSSQNAGAQSSLLQKINNSSVYDFLSGKELESGISLKSLGYEGKPITELSINEAKDLVSSEGFFGVDKTSQRVSSFVFSIADDNLEALQESRKGIVQGFEEAEKLWGDKLPEISYETQKQTLSIIDEKIAELLKTDMQKDLGDVS